MGDWTTVAQAFAVGGFPWISQMKALKIHYVLKGVDVAGISNFFASLFGLGVYAYVSYSHPVQALWLPDWWIGLAVAGLLTSIFFANFVLFREAVEAGRLVWMTIVQFVIYVLIFVSLTAGFSTLKLFEHHYIYEGRVVIQGTQTGVVGAEVRLGNDTAGVLTKTASAQDGKFRIVLEKEEGKRLRNILVTAGGMNEYRHEVGDVGSLFGTYRLIEMDKVQ